MRKVLTGLAVLATLAFASASHATTGTVAMSWTGCNAPVITDLTVGAGSTAGKLFCYVTGQSDATQSYEVWILYGSVADHTVPDAWSFDAPGCQGNSFVVINHQPPSSVAKSCFSFQDAGGPKTSFQVKQVAKSPNTLPYPTSEMLIQLADIYGLTPNAPVGGTKYFLMDVEFDETFGVVGPSDPVAGTCCGVDTPMCFNLNKAGYVPGDGSDEIFFNFHGGDDWATTNSGAAGGCQGTPTQTKTWGQIKNQYRN